MFLFRWLARTLLKPRCPVHAYELRLTPVQATCVELLVGEWRCKVCGHRSTVVYEGLR